MIRVKSKIGILVISGALAISGLVGTTSSTKASSTDPIPNTSNTEFYHDNSTSARGYSEWRVKNNDTKVYVFPTTGYDLYFKVLGKKYRDDSGNERSKVVKIPLGVEGSITNFVNENDERWAQLKMARTVSSSTPTTGWWSPDSTRNYTVFPQ
ncbi:MAG: hypothetical protein J6A82_01290 [Coprococcus sp.]|nr:hypothetical protein [Coprococcus sp.]